MSLTVNIESVHQFFSASTGELTTTIVLDIFGHRVEVPVVDDALRSVVEAVVAGGTPSIPKDAAPLTQDSLDLRRRARLALKKTGEDYRAVARQVVIPEEFDPTIPRIEEPGVIYPPNETVSQTDTAEEAPAQQAPESTAEVVSSPLDDDLFEAG